MTALLAFDTATERLAIGVARDERQWTHEGEGGAQASAVLIPALRALLATAGVGLADLDAIAFGRGPGAFTGLRTACAVAQGLAFGAGKPVLPIDTLLIVAEDARSLAGVDAGTDFEVWALLDARMDQIYAARYLHRGDSWRLLDAPALTDCEALGRRWREEPPLAVAGNALAAFADRLPTGTARRIDAAAPRAAPLLRLAGESWRAGAGVRPADALPLYVRDKVAQTTAERDVARVAGAAR